MTNAIPEYDPDDDGQFANAVVAALANLDPADAFSAYPLQSTDIGGGQVGDGELDLSITPTWTGEHQFNAGLDSRGDIVDDTTTIWDTSAGEVPDGAMGTIDNATIAALANFAPGDTFDGYPIQAADIDTGQIGAGQLDLSMTPTWTGIHTFNAGLDTQGDFTDGGQVIWDQSAQEIPDSAMGSIANGTLANDTVTVAGNAVTLGGSTAVAHADLSNIGPSQHHTKYTDNEARNAVTGTVDAADLTGASGADGQVLTSDGTNAAWEDAGGGAAEAVVFSRGFAPSFAGPLHN